jgi:protein-tyrosine-phosphatase
MATAQHSQENRPVVFVCEHGNVKSLIASSLFDKAARERGLSLRSVSRGITPEQDVPPKIVTALREDGAEVAHFEPKKLTSGDISGAMRVIAIGVDLSSYVFNAPASLEAWKDVPPASVDYAASRAALLNHINALLDELQAKGAK